MHKTTRGKVSIFFVLFFCYYFPPFLLFQFQQKKSLKNFKKVSISFWNCVRFIQLSGNDFIKNWKSLEIKKNNFCRIIEKSVKFYHIRSDAGVVEFNFHRKPIRFFYSLECLHDFLCVFGFLVWLFLRILYSFLVNALIFCVKSFGSIFKLIFWSVLFRVELVWNLSWFTKFYCLKEKSLKVFQNKGGFFSN